MDYAKSLGTRISPNELFTLGIEERKDWSTILEGKFGDYWQHVPMIDLQYCSRDWLDYSAKHFYSPVCLLYSRMLAFIASYAKAEGLAQDALPETFFNLRSNTVTQVHWIEPYILCILDRDSRALFWDNNDGAYAICLALTLTGAPPRELQSIKRGALEKGINSTEICPVNGSMMTPGLCCLLSSLTLINDPIYPFRLKNNETNRKEMDEIIKTALKRAGLSKAELSASQIDLSVIEMISKESKLGLKATSIVSTDETTRLADFQDRALKKLWPGKYRKELTIRSLDK